METLDQTTWDAVISGTGLRESLLAAALARAGRRILHVDRNSYYGDEYAAFSIDELKAWVKETSLDESSPFSNVKLRIPDYEDGISLGKSRAYTITLSPGIIYTTSPILPLMVNSNLHESLEFLKVGSWFVFNEGREDGVMLVPGGREDVFQDKSLDLKSKRAIVRTLKSIIGLEGEQAYESSRQLEGKSLEEYLSQPPNSLPANIIAAFASLTLRHEAPSLIPYAAAEEAIRRHLGSMGRFGTGFAAVVGRYGSGSELVQTLCRAAAVTGNATYVLGNRMIDIQSDVKAPQQNESAPSPALVPQLTPEERGFGIKLQEGETVWTRHVISSCRNTPTNIRSTKTVATAPIICKSVFIVSSPLKKLFTTSEPPPAAGSVIYFPVSSLAVEGRTNQEPVYIIAHNNETYECPNGQCILYASIRGTHDDGNAFLDAAANALLDKVLDETMERGRILLFLTYSEGRNTTPEHQGSGGVNSHHVLPDLLPDIQIAESAVEEAVLIYEQIVGSREGFLAAPESEIKERAVGAEDIAEDMYPSSLR